MAARRSALAARSDHSPYPIDNAGTDQVITCQNGGTYADALPRWDAPWRLGSPLVTAGSPSGRGGPVTALVVAVVAATPCRPRALPRGAGSYLAGQPLGPRAKHQRNARSTASIPVETTGGVVPVRAYSGTGTSRPSPSRSR